MSKLEKLKAVCKRYSIILAYLFGSQRENGIRLLLDQPVAVVDPLADVDVGVVFKDFNRLPETKHRLYAEIYNELSDLFIPLNLDLVFLQETHSVFQVEAITGTCIYCENDDIRDAYEHAILARAADFRYVLEKYYEERLEELR